VTRGTAARACLLALCACAGDPDARDAAVPGADTLPRSPLGSADLLVLRETLPADGRPPDPDRLAVALGELVAAADSSREAAGDEFAAQRAEAARHRLLAERRFALLEALAPLTRNRLQQEVGVQVVRGEPFGGVIPADWFRDCVAVVTPAGAGYAVLGSGVLLAPRLVLTAQHVLDQQDAHLVYVGIDVPRAAATEVVAVTGIELPPAGPFHHPDIAVLVLEQPLAGVTPVAWAAPEHYASVLAGTSQVFVAGFGSTEAAPPGRKNGGVFIPELQPGWVDLALSRYDPASELILVDSRLAGKVDTAGGDSGGPAYFRGSDGLYRLGAITARRAIPLAALPRNLPGGIYVRVDRLAGWLRAVLARSP